MRLATLTLLVVVGLGLTAPLSTAQETNAPPGNSGVSQYLETIPAADGNRPAGKGTNSSALPVQTLSRLKAAGRDGQVVAQIVASSAPASKRDQSAPNPSSRPNSASASSARSLPTTLAVPSLTGSAGGGMGILLPALLILTLVGAVVFALSRRRRLGAQ
jgi:hypothetical protein